MHKGKPEKVNQSRMTPSQKAGLKNSIRSKNMARDAAKPHRHRETYTTYPYTGES